MRLQSTDPLPLPAALSIIVALSSNAGYQIAILGPTREEVITHAITPLSEFNQDVFPVESSSIGHLVLTNGTVIYGCSAQEPEKLRGPQFNVSLIIDYQDQMRRASSPMIRTFGMGHAVQNIRLATRFEPHLILHSSI